MVWSAIVIVTVMLPLASLTLDVPRYFRLSGQLSQALAATSQDVVNTCLDMAHFERTGEVRLNGLCVFYAGRSFFDANTAHLAGYGYRMYLDGIEYDPASQRLRVAGHGEIQIFFGLTPAFTVQREAESAVRMIVK